MTVNNLSNAIIPLLNNTSTRKNMLLGYDQVRRTLGIPGVYDRGARDNKKIKHMKSIKLYLISKLAKLIILLLYNTNKWNIKGDNNYKKLINSNQSVIISIWHGRVLTFVKHLSKKQYYAVAGTHNDAEIISRICLDIGWKVIRGSSSDKGKRLLRVLLMH